jgi:hypothetical protein
LSNDFKEKETWLIKNKKAYTSSDKLNHKDISVYQANNGQLDKLTVSHKGIEVPFFDDEINNLFTVSSDLDYLID